MRKKQMDWMRSAVVGPHFFACIGIGGFFGYKLDQWLGTDKVFLLIFLVFGMAAGFVNLFRELRVVNEEEQAAEAEKAAQEAEAAAPEQPRDEAR